MDKKCTPLFQKHWTFPNKKEEITRLGEILSDLQQAYNLPEKLIFNVNLVLDELMTNVISYGFPKGGEHTLDVSIHHACEKNKHCLDVTLQDAGVAFNPLEEAESPDFSKSIEDRPIGGLGVYFAKTFATDLEYTRKNNKNILRLRFFY